ncbi:histidine kinase [Sporolactobacillus sp. STCC-11]|uniref:sensor histidine kinase n=1 Tax=Sporolactobacillus caesalpiniae TaxID=3230362 RepID=UPI003397B01F
MNLSIFEGLVFMSVLIIFLSFFLLLSLPIFEKEIDILELENVQIHLQNRLQESELMQLSRQIQPHFMFNTLNIVLSLARLNRQKELIESIESFSMYLRYKYTEKQDLISFNEEIAHVKNYLSIQKLRFGKKLDIKIKVEAIDMPAGIPPYTLQILVENAFKHGLDEKKGQKQLSIYFERLGNWVQLKVIDNGSTTLNVNASSGIGLENIRKRLSLIFDLYTDISIAKNKQNETVVQVVWPYMAMEGEQ